ncbi:MAG: 2-phosphosulfolactate phosphatase [Pirellulales bacterium]
MPNLRVHFLAEMVDPGDLAGGRSVVVDVLRATTTVVSALVAGARAVVPCLSVDEARRLASTFPPGQAVLGGERGGLPIEGFDLGNSPAEYTPRAVAGKTVVLTTTNGTKALLHCRAAQEIVLGAFVNLSALCGYLTQNAQAGATDVNLVCAGTEMHVTREDVLLAGAVAQRLAGAGWQLDDEAAIARDAWRAVSASATGAELKDRLASALRASRGGGNLIQIGMAGDIELAADVDRFAIVPRFDAKTMRIEALSQ